MNDYSVNLWGSKPGTNDDCWTGIEFDNKGQALAAFESPERWFRQSDLASTEWIEVDGPDVHQERHYQTLPQSKDRSDLEWRREQAQEAGMLHGIDAYNEVMGY